MDCPACAGVNDAGRRYCRACGGRLGQPCGVCHFFNGFDDRHCGGCGRRIPVGAAGSLTAGACVPAVVGGLGVDARERAAAVAAGVGVSSSEIDGLFESILDEEPGEGVG
jgi:hypothetical protein